MRKSKFLKFNMIAAAFLFVILGTCSFNLESYAYGTETLDGIYYVSYPEPATSDSQGYIILGIDNGGESQVVCFHWALVSENINNDMIEHYPMNISVESGSITFSVPLDTDDNIWSSGFIGYYNYAGRYRILKNYNFNTEDDMRFTYEFSSDVTVESYYLNGAIGSIATSTYKSPPTVVFVGGVFGPDVVNYLGQIYLMSSTIQSNLMQALLKLTIANTNLETIIEDNSSWYSTINETLNDTFNYIKGTLTDKIDEIINALSTPSAEDQADSDAFNEQASSQSSSLNQATQDSQTEKIDSAAAGSTVDNGIDFNAVGEYSGVLAVVTNNQIVISMLLIVFIVALISYVLFGKR